MRATEIRRHLGALAVILARLRLGEVPDHRSARGSPRLLWPMLTAIFVGCAAGCRALNGVELLTTQLSPAVRRKLGLWSRIPDTTMRDLVVSMPVEPLARLLTQQVREARRRKQLVPVGLPCGVLAIDGKHTVARKSDEVYAQRQGETLVVRTLTCSLTSARTPMCIAAHPIPKARSEESSFQPAVTALLEAHGPDLFEVITADAGITSEQNARFVDDHGLGYVFALKENQQTLLDEAVRLLGHRPATEAEAETVDPRDNRTSVYRRVWRTIEMAGYHWAHLRSVVRVQAEVRRDDGTVLSVEDRYFATNLRQGRFTAPQWLRVVRGHWRVENECHGIYDRMFREDERPWLHHAHGMLVIELIRRIVVNALDLYRRVSRRDRRTPQPWANLISWLHVALVAATSAQVAGLRWSSTSPPHDRGPPIGGTLGEA